VVLGGRDERVDEQDEVLPVIASSFWQCRLHHGTHREWSKHASPPLILELIELVWVSSSCGEASSVLSDWNAA
jgi:hypothetical protein